MRGACAARAGLGFALAFVLAGAALAQSGTPPPKRRPVAPAAPPIENAATPPPALRPASPPLVLRSAVQSRWSRPATLARATTGQCRATCSSQRLACASVALNGSDANYCDPAWTQCLSTCDGLGYSRGP